MKFKFLLTLLLMPAMCVYGAEPALYPASESSCNRSCGYNQDAASEACASIPLVQDCLRSAMSSVFAGPLGELRQMGGPDCVCAMAKLEPNGALSSVDIVRATNDTTGAAVKRALLQTRLPSVPEGAACVLKLNPIPMSFSNLR